MSKNISKPIRKPDCIYGKNDELWFWFEEMVQLNSFQNKMYKIRWNENRGLLEWMEFTGDWCGYNCPIVDPYLNFLIEKELLG